MVDPLEKRSGRIGIDISTSMLRAVSLGAEGIVSASYSKPVDPQEPAVEQLIAFINELRTEWGDLSTLGISVPGLVDRRSQRVAFSIHIPEHSDIDIVGEIRSATGVIAFIENDANAAAYGEFMLGAGRGSLHMFYITLGDGVGGAFIFDGEIWRGAAGFAGELGYVAINSEGTRLEDVASTSNIIRRTRSRFHQDSTSSLNKLPEEAITLADIVSAAKSDDDFSQMMLKRTGAYVGGAVANVINLLNIERIVVGGEIVRAKHLVLDAIIQRAHELSFEPSFDSTTIVEGILGEDAAAVGAALLGGQPNQV
jgi:glucokinase